MKKLISLIIFLSFLIPNLKAQDADVDTLYLNNKIIYKGTTFLDDSLDMNTNRIKNLVAALDLTDAINLQQLMDSLGTFELDSVSSLDFYRGIAAPAHREGRLFYDTLTKALSYYTDEADITLNIGQESWIRVYNNSGGLIEDGKVVYIDSASQDHPEIELARANAYVTSRTIGVATHDIEDGTFGYVTSYGIVRGLSLAGCTEGAVQYLDAVTAGELTETMPTGGDFVIQVGVAVDCDASGSLLVYSRTTEFTAEMILKSGFPFQPADSSNMSFSDANRYFKIEPAVTEFYYYDAGIKYIKSEADSIQITDVEGIHLIYYVNDVLTITVNPTKAQEKTVYLSYSLVSDIYWDATNNEQIYFADERHFFDMPCITHWYLHDTQGAKYLSGLALTDILADESGALDTHAQFGIDAGAITDEDYQSNLDAIGSTTGTPVYWRTGASGDWRLSTNAGFSVLTTGTGRLAWNEFTGGAWQQTEVTNGSFTLEHTFATNKTATKTITVMGQNEYSTISLARTGIATEINTLELAGLPFEEAKSISSVIYETKNTYGNAVKARIRTTVDGDDYQDWRESVTTGGGSGSGTSTTFLSLTDVPNTYAGDGDKLVGVNNAESGLEFIDTISINGATFATNVDVLGDFTIGNQFAINTTINAGFIGELQVDDTDNKSGLLIDFNETGAYYGLEINSESTTREALYAHGKFAAAFEQDLADGSGLYVRRNLAEAGSASLVEFIDEHTSNTQATLTVRQDGSGDIFQLFDAGTEVFTVLDGGNVGINDATPTEGTLVVGGTGYFSGNVTLANQLAINTTINASYQMELQVDDADNKGGLLIDMDETGAYPALRIDGSSTAELNVWSTGKYAGLFTQTISDGYGLFIDRDIAEAGSNPLVTIRDDNAATTQPTLRLRHDGTGNIFEALDGTSTVFTIADGGNTTITGNLLTGTHNTYDIGLTGTRFNHIYVDSAHANHYGNSDFSMSGTGFTITINADSTLVTSSAFGNDWQNSTKLLNANSLFDQFVALNTGGNLSNVSYLDAANVFTNAGTNSFASDVSIATGKQYEINTVSVLTATTLGSSVVNSSLTSVGTLSGGLNITAGQTYKIGGNTILPNTAMGSSATLGATSSAIIAYGNTNWGDASSFGSLPFYRGINQQMANYLQTPVKKGNNEFNTGVAGQNYFHAVAIHGDYGYALTREDPSSIIRFELEDLTARVLFTFPTTGTIYDGGQQIWYSEDLDEMMVVFGEGGEINIATVNLANTSMTLQVTITEAVSELAASGWVISDGFVYLATESVNFANKVYKVDISDWTYSSVTMSGDVSQQSHAMVFDGSHLYVGTVDNSGSNHKLFKLTTALALSDSVTIDGPPPDDIADVGDRVYIALEDASGTINYIDKGNMGKNSLETGESVESFGAFFDGTFIYVVYDTSPGTLLRVNPFDNSIRSMTYPTGYDHPNEFISDGNRYFTTFWSTTARMMRMSIPEFDAEIIYPDLYSTIWGLDSDVEIDNTGIDLGSGIEYQISGTSINTAGTLTNVAYLNQINQFSTNNEITKTGNDTFTYPLRLTNLGTASTDNVTGVGLEFNSTSDITYATVEASVFDETGNGLGSWFVKTRNDSLTEKFRIQGLGDIRIPEIAGSSATPASGYGYIRAETDGLLYWTDDGGTRYNLTAADALPAQSGKNNNFLTTNGTVASWSTTIGSAWTVLDAINFQIGTGGDLKLTHDASNSIIEQISGGTGNLLFKDAGTTYFYMDGATTKTIFSEDLLVQDSDELIVGSGSTMRMYFDGSNSNINYTTGELVLTGVPGSDPSVAGAIWSNSGVLTLSSGAPAPNPKPLPTSFNQMQNEIDLLKSENAYLIKAVEDLRLTLETFMQQNKNKN